MATFASAGGRVIVDLRIALPREGCWHGSLTLEDDNVPADSFVIDINGVTFAARARSMSVVDGSALIRFVGGAGGLGLQAKPKAYKDVPASIPISDVLAAAGETLASSAQQAVTGRQLPFWSITAGKCGQALNTLAALSDIAKPAVWRMLTDGTVWFGLESWDETSLEHEPILFEPRSDRSIIFAPSPSILPGTTWQGRHVSYVEHLIDDAVLRTTLWFEATNP